MLRIGKNPNESAEAKAPAEKQEGLAKSTETPTTASGSAGRSVTSDEEILPLTMPRKEFEQLTAKTIEVLTEATLAQQRIGKDQEEIEQLKKETRAMLAQSRAA